MPDYCQPDFAFAVWQYRKWTNRAARKALLRGLRTRLTRRPKAASVLRDYQSTRLRLSRLRESLRRAKRKVGETSVGPNRMCFADATINYSDDAGVVADERGCK
jgi:hypothetical protein